MKNIIITASMYSNKGDQAMTMILLDKIKRHFPDSKIILLTKDLNALQFEKDSEQFQILPYKFSVKLRLAGGILKTAEKYLYRLFRKNENRYLEYDPILKEAIVDSVYWFNLSGYSLSSRFNILFSIAYICEIIIAKKYNVKMYLLTQSFGPFNYKFPHKNIMNFFIKKYLKYPELIIAREEKSLEYLKPYELKNLEYHSDMVLHSKNYNLNVICNLLNRNPNKLPDINDNSVAIIPNIKNEIYGKPQDYIKVYNLIVKTLIEYKYNIYLLTHCNEDMEICNKIKSNYADNNKVIILEEEYDCIDIDELINKFNFVIASRYHSIIHSFRNGVPALIIGWAEKYKELVSLFGQNEYFLDTREIIDTDQVSSTLHNLIGNYKNESQKILDKLEKFQEDDYLEVLFNRL